MVDSRSDAFVSFFTLIHTYVIHTHTRLQLEKHVSEWKRVLVPDSTAVSGSGSGADAPSAVGVALREVAAIESNILQANADSLLIIDNISGILTHMKI